MSILHDRSANLDARLAEAISLLQLRDNQILTLTNQVASLKQKLESDQQYIRKAKDAAHISLTALDEIHRPYGYF